MKLFIGDILLTLPLIILSVCAWIALGKKPQRLRFMLAPWQHDADALIERIWRCRVARNRKAHAAYLKMIAWHRDPSS